MSDVVLVAIGYGVGVGTCLLLFGFFTWITHIAPLSPTPPSPTSKKPNKRSAQQVYKPEESQSVIQALEPEQIERIKDKSLDERVKYLLSDTE